MTVHYWGHLQGGKLISKVAAFRCQSEHPYSAVLPHRQGPSPEHCWKESDSIGRDTLRDTNAIFFLLLPQPMVNPSIEVPMVGGRWDVPHTRVSSLCLRQFPEVGFLSV